MFVFQLQQTEMLYKLHLLCSNLGDKWCTQNLDVFFIFFGFINNDEINPF